GQDRRFDFAAEQKQRVIPRLRSSFRTVPLNCPFQSGACLLQFLLLASGLSFHPVCHRIQRFSQSVVELALLHSDSFRQLKTRQLCPIFPLGDLHDEKDSHLRLHSTDQASQCEILLAGTSELEENTVCESPYLV